MIESTPRYLASFHAWDSYTVLACHKHMNSSVGASISTVVLVLVWMCGCGKEVPKKRASVQWSMFGIKRVEFAAQWHSHVHLAHCCVSPCSVGGTRVSATLSCSRPSDCCTSLLLMRHCAMYNSVYTCMCRPGSGSATSLPANTCLTQGNK